MAKMVDIADKPPVKRTAIASGKICMKPETIGKIKSGEVPKGDVLTVAQTAAILAVKRTPEIVPLTHPIPITSADVSFDVGEDCITARVEVQSTGQTGVEMEALTAVAVAALTVYDMCKAVDRGMKITDIRLVHKAGGKSGTFEAE